MIPNRTIELAFASPRKLPKAGELRGAVAVLDIAFASEAGGKNFETTTLKFIRELGTRLRAWVDHHDSDHHAAFQADARFCLSTKAEHPACPEMITPELVQRLGPVDTVVCHTDFDGLASAAKWLRNGEPPYEACDEDARAIDTRLGIPSPVGVRIDRALRARPRDQALFGLVVRHLTTGLADSSLWQPIDEAGAQLNAIEAETRKLALSYRTVAPNLACIDASQNTAKFDKTLLLMLGQERAPISLVVDRQNATFAARFDSGINFLPIFGISGGMPTRVSIERPKLAEALRALGVTDQDAEPFIVGK